MIIDRATGGSSACAASCPRTTTSGRPAPSSGSSSCTASACRPASSATAGSTGSSATTCRPTAHPFFATIAELTVSAHVLIARDGALTQYVPFDRRAWHAGKSQYCGRSACNDFSVGIELEGTDDCRTSPRSTARSPSSSRRCAARYPSLRDAEVVGHSDIAPGRKTDPGPAFDWSAARARARGRERDLGSAPPQHLLAAVLPRERSAPSRTADPTAGSSNAGARGSRRAACAAAHALRSARRQIVRATWQTAAARVPPGSTNSLSGGSVVVQRVEIALEPRHVLAAICA